VEILRATVQGQSEQPRRISERLRAPLPHTAAVRCRRDPDDLLCQLRLLPGRAAAARTELIAARLLETLSLLDLAGRVVEEGIERAGVWDKDPSDRRR